MNAQKLELSKFLDYVQNQLNWSNDQRVDFSNFLKMKKLVFIEDGKQKIEIQNATTGLNEFKNTS